MAEQYLPDIVGQYRQGLQFGTERRQQREAEERQSRLSELASLAYGAQGDERRGLIGQAYGVDPQFAAGLSKQLGGEDEARQTALLQSARLLQSAPPELRPGLYQRIRPSMSQYLPDLPPEYGPQVEKGTAAFIAAYGGGGAQDVKVVGDTVYDPATRQVIYRAPKQYLTDRGLVEYVPGEGVRELTIGGQQPDGMPVVFDDADIPQPVREAALGQRPWTADTPDIVGGGGAPSGRILPRGAGIQQEQLQLSRQAAARAEETAQRAREADEQRRQFGAIPPGFRVNAAGTALEPVPGGPKPAGAAATEGERKSATLLKRLEGSLSQLETAVREDPSAAKPGIVAEVGRSLPFIGNVAANVLNPAERQRVEAAQLDILDAALTLGTGAAYTREQLEGYRRSFFPQLGDGESTVQDKQARLQNVIGAARIAAGRAATENAGGGAAARPTTEAEYNRLPSGALFIDPDDGRTYRKP